MKLEELRKVIREEVEKAFKEQLKDVLIEAVQIASAPSTLKTEQKTNTKQITNFKAPVTQPKKYTPTGNPIEDMLQMTKATMTSADAAAIMGEGVHMPNMASTVAQQMHIGGGNQPGLDLSQLPFINKAKTLLEAANEKDRQRKGL